jgi:hypothetical protein
MSSSAQLCSRAKSVYLLALVWLAHAALRTQEPEPADVQCDTVGMHVHVRSRRTDQLDYPRVHATNPSTPGRCSVRSEANQSQGNIGVARVRAQLQTCSSLVVPLEESGDALR